MAQGERESMSWWNWIRRQWADKPASGEGGGAEGGGDGSSDGRGRGGDGGGGGAADGGGGQEESPLEEGRRREAQGDLAGALVAFGKAVVRDPSADAWCGRGVVHCKLERYPEAIADLNRALKLRPCFPAAIAERGLAYVQSGELERGIEDHDTAIAIDPSCAAAHTHKANAYLRRGRGVEAILCLELALQLAPGNAGGAVSSRATPDSAGWSAAPRRGSASSRPT
jgi:tetratricopeptide (TPR) repeat protein